MIVNPNGNEEGIPSGLIAMWSGPVSAIPSGWALCNGSNGTPDLRDRFIVGAGSSYNVGASGGNNTVKLTPNQMPRHKHGFKLYNTSSGAAAGTDVTVVNGANVVEDWPTGTSGESQPHENRPPYYALCFIMKT